MQEKVEKKIYQKMKNKILSQRKREITFFVHENYVQNEREKCKFIVRKRK